MKKLTGVGLAALMLQASGAFAAVIQDWSSLGPGAAGTYNDSNGTKVDFSFEDGPTAGTKALKITTNLVSGGYAGIYTNTSGDISKAANLVFMVKSSAAGDIQLAIKDAFNVQYIEKVTIVAGDWAPVTVSLAAFIKDPYYTPPDAIAGHPMDFSKISNLNFSPQMTGASVVEIGPIEASGTASASPASSSSSGSAAASSAPSGPAVQVLDPSTIDAKSAGTFQDSQGSSFTFTAAAGAKYLSITYELKQGGYCGMWCRAGGADWSGANLAGAQTLSLQVYSKAPVVLGIALKDKNNNQYVADSPSTKGSGWETISIPMASFSLDPYYTPPDAIKGAPKDFSKVATFNIQPKTVGKFTIAVSKVVAQ